MQEQTPSPELLTSERLNTASLFFFSSRRRHTRFSRDWSSDVCSSDLPRRAPGLRTGAEAGAGHPRGATAFRAALGAREIGRASCRERVYISVVVVSLRTRNGVRRLKGGANSGSIPVEGMANWSEVQAR